MNVKFGNGAQETSQRLIEMPAAWLADEGSFERPSSKVEPHCCCRGPP